MLTAADPQEQAQRLSTMPPRRGQRARAWTLATTSLLVASFTCATASAEPSKLPPEIGHNYSEQETPRMTALGGPMRASSNSLSALYSNPANMAAAQVYHVGAFAQLHPESRRQSYGGAIVDSLISNTGLAGGFGAVWTLQDPDGIDRQWTDLRFGLAMPLGDVVFIGLSGRYITLQQNGVGPLGRSDASGGLHDSNIIQTITADAGVTVRPIPEFSVALTGYNLTNIDTALVPLTGGLGIGFNTKDFGLNADIALESRTYSKASIRASGGGEFLIADRVMVRAGYRYDQGLQSHAFSGGLGYVDQRFAIDASARRGIGEQPYTQIVFGFTVHIEALSLGPSSPDTY